MRYEKEYTTILNEELKKAMGCTEPIAISYLSCIAKDLLGQMPDKVEIFVSGNILKNVKSVVVPNTGGLRGIKAAIAIGMIGGEAKSQLECLCKVTEESRKKCIEFLQTANIQIHASESEFIFDIHIFMFLKQDVVEARIVDHHTNLVLLRKNQDYRIKRQLNNVKKISDLTNHKILDVKDIIYYAKTIDILHVQNILDEQINCNMKIAEEGMNHSYGANIGSTLLKTSPNDIAVKAKAYAAAASDARMNGCELPVVINSGSGNQGITCSVPVIVYARELKCTQEKLYRALLLSNLFTIHIKTGIGRLSAFCGAVAAGCAAGAAIAYLYDASDEDIAHTLVNSLAIVSGMICDGAKASCAAKIASSVDAGILGYQLCKEGNVFHSGDGIVTASVEDTIRNIGAIASLGMKETDKEIIHLMLQS